MTFTATYSRTYSKEYLSGQLKEELLQSINSVEEIDLSAYSVISSVESRLNELTESDRAIVQEQLNKLIADYNSFVNAINGEFEESISVANKWLFGTVVASVSSLLTVAALFLRRRFPL